MNSPNIIFILIDDLGWKDLSCQGSSFYETPNIDSLAFQAALVGLVYVATYGRVKGLGSLLAPDIASMLWGFFFFFGLICAFAAKRLMNAAGAGYLVDNGIQRRITGWSIDFLIVSTGDRKLTVCRKVRVPERPTRVVQRVEQLEIGKAPEQRRLVVTGGEKCFSVG